MYAGTGHGATNVSSKTSSKEIPQKLNSFVWIQYLSPYKPIANIYDICSIIADALCIEAIILWAPYGAYKKVPVSHYSVPEGEFEQVDFCMAT